MYTAFQKTTGAFFIATTLALGGQALAQQKSAPKDPTGAEASPLLRRHHEMQGIMQEMTQEMNRMREQMGDEKISADARKDLSARMKRMSAMMNRMSGLVDRPSMSEQDAKRQFEQMRKEMKSMDHPAEKPKAN
jgi:hypothetical protein